MKTRILVLSTVVLSLLALAGCAEGVHPAAADYPMLGFASPGDGASEPSASTRFEEVRMLPKPVVITDSWAH
ncbi:MAG: hypothetical protein ABSE49_32700 [Polyangiaceae bacterium]|jgi:hypothetical protein